eukprot:gene948-9855_t
MFQRVFKRGKTKGTKICQKNKYNSYSYEEIRKLNKIDPEAVIEIFESENCEKTDEIKKEYLRAVYQIHKKSEQPRIRMEDMVDKKTMTSNSASSSDSYSGTKGFQNFETVKQSNQYVPPKYKIKTNPNPKGSSQNKSQDQNSRSLFSFVFEIISMIGIFMFIRSLTKKRKENDEKKK